MNRLGKNTRSIDDWRKWKNGWKYKRDAPYDPEWKKDRLKVFKKNGNGWWWLQEEDEE